MLCVVYVCDEDRNICATRIHICTHRGKEERERERDNIHIHIHMLV